MRKIYYLAMAVVLTAMVGCQKDDEFINVQNDIIKTFYATFEDDAKSRTSLDADNNVLWSVGDQISVFSGSTANNSFILSTGENTTYGEFVVNSLSARTESNSSASTLSANVAYYPYDSNVTVSENNGSYTFNATFPATQTYVASGTFGNGASPMVAVTVNTLDADLKFKNVGAIFRLQLKGEATITKVVFSANADLAGDCQIAASNTDVPTVSVTEGSNAIVLDCGEGVQLSDSEATNFIVAMLPVENVTGGITITIYDNAGKKMVYTHKADETITIKRSKAYTTTEVTYSGDQDANTTASVQAALDAATNGTIIELEPGVDYGTLVFRAIPGQSHTTLEDIADAWAYNYTRSIEDVTIIGAAGATVDAIKFETGALPGDQNNRVAIKNLVIDGVTFTDKLTVSAAGYNAPIMITTSNATVDGLTVQNCTLVGNNDKLNLVYLYGADGAKNITLSENTVEGIARLCELRGTENVTITNNTIKNTAEHAMLLTGSGYSGNVTITDNTADGINDRFVRMAGAGDATVVITDNVITNYKGEDADYIKVTGSTGTLTIENNSCAYTVSTADKVQAALNSATNGTTIQLEPGVDYGTIVFGKNIANGKTVDITDIGGDAAGNEYYSKFENITIIGAPGATVDQITFDADKLDDNTAWNYIDVKNLTIKDVTFTGEKTAVWISENAIAIDGLTILNCKMNDADSNDRFVYQPLIGHKELTDKTTNEYVMTRGVKNIKIDGCEIVGAYQVIEGRQMENITITNNNFKDIKARDILLASGGDGSVTYSGTITITGNTSDGSTDRFVRMAGVGDATVVITDNVITNYKGEDADYIKVSGSTGSLTIENNSCAYTVSTVDALTKVLKANSDGAQITLAAGTYNQLSFTDPANYLAKNVTIIGQDGVTIDGFSVNNWSAESNIEINGLTFKNITFTAGLLLSTKVMSNVTVEECKFVNDACIHQDDKKEKLSGLKVVDCDFTGDKNGTKTALMLENVENLTVTGSTFTNIDFNVLQTNILSGTVLFDNNIVNGTGDRVFRFVETANGTDVTISNNTITSDGDGDGQLAKSSNPIEITLTNNTWNGQTDAQIADKLINITAK